MEEQKNVEETLAEETKQEVKEETEGATSKKENSWKTVRIGGVAGILLGGTATAMIGFADANDIEDVPKPDSHHGEAQVPNTNVTVDGLPVAESVNDDMSFGEAFASARAETGAGGVFSWRGGVYGTYLADEWNGMTAEEQAAFGSRVHYGTGNGGGTVADIKDTPADELVAEADVEVENPNAEQTDAEALEVESVEPTADIETEVEADVEVETEQEVEAEAEALETEALIPSQELLDSEVQQMEIQNDMTMMDGNAPDYVNDADISGFEMV